MTTSTRAAHAAKYIQPSPVAELKWGDNIYLVSIQEFDYDRASLALERNEGNRKIKEHIVRKYAQDMLSGLWTLTGDPVVFDEDGNLINGQHRLTAAKIYRTSFVSLVIHGVPRAVQRDMDQGAKRTAADDANMKGEAYSTILTSLVAAYMIYQNSASGYNARNAGAWTVSKSAVAAYFEADAERADRFRDAAEFYHKHIQPAPYVFRTNITFALVYMHLLEAGVQQSTAQAFFEGLKTGADVSYNSPVYVLRQRLIMAKSNRENLNGMQVAHMLITAWNHYFAGNSLQQVKVYDPNALLRLKEWPKIAH
jgi:hypothetical protein